MMAQRCSVERIACGNVNCYLVRGPAGAILVDTGRAAQREKVLNACRGAGVRLLVLTHGHVDHVQNAAFLAEALGVPIAMSPADAGLARDNCSRALKGRGLMGKALLAASVRSFRRDPIPAFAASVWLEDGDRLDEYGVPARVLALPGHTAGSIGLDLPEGRPLGGAGPDWAGGQTLVGDALMNMGRPGLSLLYEDREALAESGRVIAGLGERRIWFGHGGPVGNRVW